MIEFQGWLGSGQRGAVVLDNINITHITEVRFAVIDFKFKGGLTLSRLDNVDITLATRHLGKYFVKRINCTK